MVRRNVVVWVSLTLILVCGAVYVVSSRGVRIAVLNHGPGTLGDAVVHVTGNTYPIGDVESGALVSVRVEPDGESHAEVEFTGSDGVRYRLDVDTYFEANGYHGTITVEIRSNAIEHVDDAVEIGIF